MFFPYKWKAIETILQMEIGSLTEQESIPVGCEPPALSTVCASVATRCLHLGARQVNKFEQVSSLGHQMSLAEGS